MDLSRSVRLLTWLAVLAVLALTAWALWIEPDLRPAASAVLLLVGAAPLLLRWTPVEPSPIKLGLFAILLSPPLLTVLHLASGSWPLTLGVVGALQLLALGKPLRFERPGKVVLTSLGVGLALAAGLAWLSFAHGWAARLDTDAQVWQAAVAEMLLRGGPLEHPFLAGTPLPSHPGHAALIATVATGLELPVASAAAWVGAWAALTLPVSLLLIAAPLWGEPRRVLSAPLLFLIAWAAFEPLGAASAVDPVLAGGPDATALAFAAGAWLAAAHGLRHGRRPWVGLAGLMAGLTLAVDPIVGAATLATILVVALVAPGAAVVRGVATVSGLAWALPGLWLARRHGVDPAPLAAPALAGALVAFAPLVLPALAGGWERAAPAGPPRRTLLALGLVGAIVPLGLALAAPRHAPTLARLATVALASLAAGGLWRAVESRGGLRGPALHAVRLVALGLVVLSGVALARTGAARLEQARAPLRLVLEGGALAPDFTPEAALPGTGLLDERVASTRDQVARAIEIRRRHRALAYRWMRDNRAALGERALLWRSLAGHGDRARGRAGLHFAPLYTGLPLWCDDAQSSGTGSPRWPGRRERARALYEREGGFGVQVLRELEHLGRPAVFLVEEFDREATQRRGPRSAMRGLDLDLARIGAEPVHVTGTVAVWLWRPKEANDP